MTMSVERFRETFEVHCGSNERYRKFLRMFNQRSARPYLLYWQQELWDAFVRAHQELADLTVHDLVPLFRLCWVHLVPLEDRQLPVEKGLKDIYFTHEFRRATAELFPYAPRDCALDHWDPQECPTHITVDYCPECDAAMQRWESPR